MTTAIVERPPATAAVPAEDLVTLSLPRELMELVRVSVAHHATGVRSWAAMPGEVTAREILTRLEQAQTGIEAALREDP